MIKRRIYNFLKGMTSVLEIFLTENSLEYNHPIYSRKDLTPQQKDAMNLASDWKNVTGDLENEIYRNKNYSK